jgi:hypothetical protein
MKTTKARPTDWCGTSRPRRKLGRTGFKATVLGVGDPGRRDERHANEADPKRTAAFRNHVTQALQNPNLVGYHWVEYCDASERKAALTARIPITVSST